MSLTKEQYEQLPDFVKSDYVETSDGFKHGGMIKVKQTADDLNSKLETERKSREEINERLKTIESEQEAKIEAARNEALEKAKTKGDVAEIEKRYQEQMADIEKRTAERVRGETIAEISKENAKREATSIAKQIAARKALEGAEDTLFELLEKRVTINEAGKTVFLNDDGSASVLTQKEFEAELDKSNRFKYLIKASSPTSGGGMLNGSNGKGSAEPTQSKTTNKLQSRKNKAAEIARKYNL